MVMAGRNRRFCRRWLKLSFHSRVLFTVLLLCWVLVATFIVFQYHRERGFKSELLDTRLQAYNGRLIEDMRRGEKPDAIVRRIGTPMAGTRVTIVAPDGSVAYDSNDATPFPSANHAGRHEVMEARRKGSGFTVERHSESDDVDYFYSARLGDGGYVVRSAVPYTHSLQDILEADRSLLWILGVMTLMMGVAGFLAARKISITVSRLNRFAAKAERGEPIFSDEAFPDDELGSIAGHIVRLYVQRDARHREAMRQEQDKIRLKKQLTNNINHELKTPVAAMLVCLELLHDHPELPPERQREFIDRMLADARRLDALLKDVSTITRMDEGERVLLKEPVDLAEVVGDVVAATMLPDGVTLTADVAPMVIDGNREMLESVFRNLIDNALAYSGGTCISIMSDKDGRFVFRDNGVGVPDEHLPHIFERFYRVDRGRSRRSGGTGLGLAIVRNAVRLHGGSITVSNDGGLRFDFDLK